MQGNEKKKYVKGMFNDIAENYDLLNHLLSMGADFYWRKRAIQLMEISDDHLILDLATGTGDLAIAAAKKSKCNIIGLDIAFNMMLPAREKIQKKGLSDRIAFVCGDGENMPFKDDVFDRGMIAFGIRNMGNISQALNELNRVLKKKGRLMVLEFSTPQIPLFRELYALYFKLTLPLIGKIISGHADAYSYLPESVSNFPAKREFMGLMADAGFIDIRHKNFTFGICTAYLGVKQ